MITLISSNYESDMIGQMIPKENVRDVFGHISSVSSSEWRDAGQMGLKAEYRVTMFVHDYQGEEIVALSGIRYGVYRTYLGKNETIELYLEKKAGV